MRKFYFTVFISSLALSLSMGLVACVDKAVQASETRDASETIGAIDLPDLHRNVIATFDMASNATPENLLEAATRLERIGATPMASNDNRARQWQETALRLKPALADEALPFRGRVKGPAYREHKLAPGETETLREVFYAAEKANLSLDPRDSQITLGVNEVGETKTVCNFPKISKIVSCEWVPIHTAPYNIAITNMGETPVTYLLVSN